MKKLPTTLEGPLLLEPVVHGDARGFFLETFREDGLAELGITERWVRAGRLRLQARVPNLRKILFARTLPRSGRELSCSSPVSKREA